MEPTYCKHSASPIRQLRISGGGRGGGEGSKSQALLPPHGAGTVGVTAMNLELLKGPSQHAPPTHPRGFPGCSTGKETRLFYDPRSSKLGLPPELWGHAFSQFMKSG